jgi:hypothetical protein
VWLGTVGQLGIGEQAQPQFIIWADDAPTVLDVHIIVTDGLLRFYNVNEYPPGTGMHRSQENGSGMIQRSAHDGWLEYSCNDFGVGEKFDKLVFSVLLPGHPD